MYVLYIYVWCHLAINCVARLTLFFCSASPFTSLFYSLVCFLCNFLSLSCSNTHTHKLTCSLCCLHLRKSRVFFAFWAPMLSANEKKKGRIKERSQPDASIYSLDTQKQRRPFQMAIKWHSKEVATNNNSKKNSRSSSISKDKHIFMFVANCISATLERVFFRNITSEEEWMLIKSGSSWYMHMHVPIDSAIKISSDGIYFFFLLSVALSLVSLLSEREKAPTDFDEGYRQPISNL